LRSKLLLLLVLVAPLARAAEFEVRPTPTWVVWARPPSGAQLSARAGVAGILTDHQVRVAGANVDEYFRRVRKVVTAAGVQNASELSIDFDPSYQRLVLHDIALVRGAARINQLDPRDVRVIEKEPESDSKIFDGQLTALVFLKDVRPGDIIDYAFSLDGANPLLGGRYADEFDFSATVPTALVRHRLLWPAARPLHVRGAGQVEHHGALDVYSWEHRNVEADADEDSTPDWYDAYDSVQVSEYGSWNEVAQWSADMFKPDLASVAAVETLAAKIRGEHRSRDAQISAAIRFVQDDIRYLGIEMGRGSHEPRQPRATLEQRYGDCKDKAFLLSLLLGRLDVEAHPALVNTKLRHRLDEFLPSPFLFDHVITQVVDGGHTYWIDGTIADQGGTLATIDTPSDERALVVRPDTRALAHIDIASRASTSIDEMYNVNGDDATLEVATTYRGRDADDLRADFSDRTPADYAKERLNHFAADHPRIERAAAPAISDDRDRNVIVVRERYVVHRLWKDGEWTFVPRAIEDHLARPKTLIRGMPLAVEFPLDLTERVTVRGAAASKSENIVDTPALHYERRAGKGGVTWVLRSKKDAVAVRDVPDHIAALNALDDELSVAFATPRAGLWTWVISAIAAVLLVGLTVALALRRRVPAIPPGPAEPVGIGDLS
jgi:transglutaminase-like putative cysteine protease